MRTIQTTKLFRQIEHIHVSSHRIPSQTKPPEILFSSGARFKTNRQCTLILLEISAFKSRGDDLPDPSYHPK
jgi:hypothetical protein